MVRPCTRDIGKCRISRTAVMDTWTTTAQGAPTPSTAGAGAKQAQAALPRGVRYYCPLTQQTWSGRGLRPAWLKAALAGGRPLSDFEVQPEGKVVKVDAGLAGERAKSTELAEADAA